MKKLLLSLAFVTLALATSVTSAKAADVNFGADVVSTYVGRNGYQTGASIQPSASIGFGNFAVSAWGSTPISTGSHKEFDLTLSYTVGDFKLIFNDFWWNGQGAKYFDADDHFYEVGLAYSRGGFSGAVYTFVAGADRDENGDFRNSTFIDLAYGFAVKDVNCAVGVAITPFKGLYSGIYDDEFEVCSVSLSAAKAVKITESYSLPLFVKAIFCPAYDDAFLVFGMSF